MTLLRSFIIMFPLSALLIASEPFESLSAHISNVLPSIVKIKTQRSDSGGDESELIVSSSGGTGFVYDDEHHILTNAHVIGDAKRIAVVDLNDTEYTAILIGKDDQTDIAVIRVPGLNLPMLKRGSSDVKVGDGLLAIGYPFSLGRSVSLGIAGGLRRFLPNYPYMHFIQTDAAINPGNSGGPLFNLNGEVVGMVSTYFSRQGGYTNIAFAIPIDDAARITEQLIRDGKIERGYLGTELLISEKVVRKMGEKNGVLVTRIDPTSPASKAGIKPGDIIVGINGIDLQDNGEVHRTLERSHAGDTITFTLMRERRKSTTDVILGTPVVKKETVTNVSTADQAEKLGLVLRENDRVIEVVMSYAVAKLSGFEPKDKIHKINGKPITMIKELNAQLAKLNANDLALIHVERDGEFLTLPIGSKSAIKGYAS